MEPRLVVLMLLRSIHFVTPHSIAFPNLIHLYLLGMYHQPSQIHILMQHRSPTLLQNQTSNTYHKLAHTSSGVRNQIRSILRKLVELQAILLNSHGALPQVHKLLNLCLPHLKKKELVQECSLEYLSSHRSGILASTLP